ncbi:MAG: hypothetical protein PHQ18_01575 [Patescibacteria group bacterium]|nr:hypothetical protein [Patescibacteria group bacterium]
MKRLFIILVFGFVLLPQFSLANLDQKCWTEEDCLKFREDFGSADATGGFYSAKDHEDARLACKTNTEGTDLINRKIGFCLPAGQAITTISFGGRTQFSNVGEFIKFIYQYGFIVGSVVAVMVIIVAGVMYIFSGGNSDTVGQAKKKIMGSVIGLILMALSYTILNTINPYLVNFRLPSIWAINTEGIAPIYCENLGGDVKIALANAQSSSSTINIDKAQWFDISTSTIALCGNNYYVDKTGGQSCLGQTCTDNTNLCFGEPTAAQTTSYKCVKGTAAGIITNSSFAGQIVAKGATGTGLVFDALTDYWTWPWVGGDVTLFAVCENGALIESNYDDEPLDIDNIYKQTYLIPKIDNEIISLENRCKASNSKLLGYALEFEMNIPVNGVKDEKHLIGMDQNGNAVDLCNNMSIFGGLLNIRYSVCQQIFLNSNSVARPDKYLISKEKMLKGVILNLDADTVGYDNNDVSKMVRHYSKFGFTGK